MFSVRRIAGYFAQRVPVRAPTGQSIHVFDVHAGARPGPTHRRLESNSGDVPRIGRAAQARDSGGTHGRAAGRERPGSTDATGAGSGGAGRHRERDRGNHMREGLNHGA